jgi:hypothetical protein
MPPNGDAGEFTATPVGEVLTPSRPPLGEPAVEAVGDGRVWYGLRFDDIDEDCGEDATLVKEELRARPSGEANG